MQKFPTIPDRIRLPHAAPEWIGDDAKFFITICCAGRGENSLANAVTWESVLKTTVTYAESRRWWPLVMLAMPDHLHAIASFPDDSSLRRTVSDFKHVVARFSGVEWQRDFFDHRLRSAESSREKFDYILNNPVRGGLVEKPEDWHYRYIAPVG